MYKVLDRLMYSVVGRGVSQSTWDKMSLRDKQSYLRKYRNSKYKPKYKNWVIRPFADMYKFIESV
jgi:hypothetical protein